MPKHVPNLPFFFTFHVSRFTSRFFRFTLYCLLLTAYCLLSSSPSAHAQPAPVSYWQYSASGQLLHITPADVNRDGVDELLVADENGNVVLVDANGLAQWRFTAPETILAMGAANLIGVESSALEVFVVTQTYLIVVNENGDEQWRTQITAVSIPPLLLTNGGEEDIARWNAQYTSKPVAATPFDYNQDGRFEILVLLQSNQLQLYDPNGQLLWRYAYTSTPYLDTQPHMQTGDLNADGRPEIVLTFFNPRRFTEIAVINGDGTAHWEKTQPLTGRVTALALVSFDNRPQQYIAVGTNQGQINLYDYAQQKIWLRTPNKPITALTAVQLPTGGALVAGTDVGTLILFNREGQRLWTRQLSLNADRRIATMTAADFAAQDNQPMLSITVGPQENTTSPTDLILLGSDNRILKTVPNIDNNHLTRLVDLNHDQKNELLVARFATVELSGLGIGESENASAWEWTLKARPSSYLVVDFDQDGNDEIVIGAEDGRLHRLDNNPTSFLRWVQEAQGAFTHLAVFPTAIAGPAKIVAVHNNTIFSPNNENSYESWVELRQSTGEEIWEQALPTQITGLYVGDVNNRGEAEIVAGTREGEIYIYTSTGANLGYIETGDGSIESFVVIRNLYTQATELLAVTHNAIYKVIDNLTSVKIASYPTPITAVYPLNQPRNELSTALLVFLEDGSLSGLNWRGIALPQWQNVVLAGSPLATLFTQERVEEAFEDPNTAESFLVASSADQLLRLNVTNNQPAPQWRATGLPDVTSLYWGDLNGDALPEIAIGDKNGIITILTRDLKQDAGFEVASQVFAITALQREAEQQSDLLVVTENGRVQLFRAQENFPPLLTQPQTTLAAGQYNFSINIADIEQDTVQVILEIFDSATQTWQRQTPVKEVTGSGSLTWLVFNPPTTNRAVRYRFSYDDGFHQGIFAPPPGPEPIAAIEPNNLPATTSALVGVSGLLITVLLVRQIQSPTLTARRFYRHLKEKPAETLLALESRYIQTSGSPDFLLSLSNQARQRADYLLASLADGLFLLADRPHAGLPIIIGAVDDAQEQTLGWQDIERWRKVYKTGHTLLEAPSITELSLLRPLLVDLLAQVNNQTQWWPILDALLPILTNIRDSERVQMAEDKLVYLNEAVVSLSQLRDELPEFSPTIEKTLVKAIINRWLGLVTAEIAELRGRAELAIILKTKQLVPRAQTEIALEIRNNGRAPAENIIITLDKNPAYRIHSPQQTIPVLPPGRTRQVTVSLEPTVHDRFRLSLTVVYDDRSQPQKQVAFGDMVHLLPPIREFNPVPNPYLPGTPLRQNSPLFFGRDDLFSFIAENAGRLSQRNVLILIGQRRTGKTSMLLRLGQHLPPHLLPIYIDCQSLGVAPGMPALLYDLAWHIADALARRNIQLEVPEPEQWQADPNGRFQRQFLPQVRQLLPPDTTLLLVFDEFEAFENLVNDGILPATFFTYMRHLMQHSDGLSFIFVGTHRLEEMSADYWSVLFNIALYRKIGYLREPSATRLIREPVAPNLVYDDLAIDKILRVTAGHPYFLQLVCYTLVQQANAHRNGYVTISDVNTALDEMLRLGEAHFAFLWQRSSQVERALLTAMAHLIDAQHPLHPEQLLQYLEPYDIHPTPTEVTAALNQLVERDILREIREGATVLYELKISLVGLWVAKHKSLSKLYATNGEERPKTKERLLKRK